MQRQLHSGAERRMDAQRSRLQWLKRAQSSQFLLCSMDHTAGYRDPKHQSFGKLKRLDQYDLRGAEWNLQSRYRFRRPDWSQIPHCTIAFVHWLFDPDETE